MATTGLLGLWIFGLHGRGVEIASSPPRIRKRVLIV